MSRHKMISVLALPSTAGYVAFVLLAPADATKPINQALVVGLLLAYLGVTLRAVYRDRRATHRTQPHADHPQPPCSPTP